ncbi:hypothetical protein [Paenibacillus sp. VTT E-133291]|uniref:hypothetical protein n=1 Tax=Paenibacillus sp. VTT E-133291 TaxID=1986223 RepID=UPI000BA04162|nr:hypothetical protein [Paenibacillus sp. VTT E-133291]OZQ97351.1 hypothetical protein CA598_06045 [Paenibacillus sp. VTT E-133291]
MIQRDWKKDMEMCEAAPKGPWIIHPKYQDLVNGDGEVLVQEVGWGPVGHLISESRTALPYWLQEARERGEREQRLKELLSDTMGCLVMSTSKDNEDVARIAADYSTLFPDTPTTPEIKQQSTARTLDDWHEDIGTVLWWTFPIEEPPYCGTPLDADYPDYLTHWTPIVEPAAPAPKEGE